MIAVARDLWYSARESLATLGRVFLFFVQLVRYVPAALLHPR